MIFRYELVPERRYAYVSPACTAISGYTPEEHYGNPELLHEIVHPEDRAILADTLVPRAHGEQAVTLRWLHKDGWVVHVEQTFHLEQASEDDVVAIEGVVRNVTERTRERQLLEYEARRDPVTLLASAHLLEERLATQLTDPDRPTMVVVAVRLQRFTTIADHVGTAEARSLLRAAGARLVGALPDGVMVAGTGSGLFWLLVVEQTPGESNRYVESVAGAFDEPLVSADGHDTYLEVSVGARRVEPAEDCTVDTVLGDTTAALRTLAGGDVRASARWFDPALRKAIAERLDLEHDLREAVRAGEIGVAYQPQVDMRTGFILGFEALARWNRHGFGPVGPDVFAAVAEDIGLIADLDDHVLFAAARQLARWRAAGLVSDQRVSVNLSRRQLGLPDLAVSLLEITAAVNLPPEGFTVEVTETGVTDAGDRAGEQLHHLAERGVRISIDDFGTGYSSLSALRELPVHELKVDRSFVSGLSQDSVDGAICSAVVGLARGLGLDLVAEGVETRRQADALIELGCPVGQGYLFGRPVPAEAVPALIARAPR